MADEGRVNPKPDSDVFCGLEVVVDESMPRDVVEFRYGDKCVGKITGLAVGGVWAQCLRDRPGTTQTVACGCGRCSGHDPTMQDEARAGDWIR